MFTYKCGLPHLTHHIKTGTTSAKKGPANKKQRGAAGGAVEVQDLTAGDGNNNNNSDTEQAAAGMLA